LILTHVKELVEQNYHKFTRYADERGVKAGIFSAGLHRKEIEFQVTFASVQSVARNMAKFATRYSLVVIDECHRVSQFGKEQADDELGQYGKIVTELKAHNAELKILGLTATPYRMGMGWIYQYHYHGIKRTDDRRPFDSCIYELPMTFMIKRGYLTPPAIEDAPVAQYDFSALNSNGQGEYLDREVNALLVKYPRVTEAIIEQVVAKAQPRQGVMIFAATVKHAHEILGYLPAKEAALITGKTPLEQRAQQISAFKARELKYLVNVSVLTTGFDAPHVDLIAILRPTESISLYQQIVGRGLRLAEGKKDCLVIDYAGNGINIFYPEIGSKKPNSSSELVQVFCPSCGFANLFWGKKDKDGQILEHYGRKCQGFFEDEQTLERQDCDYRFRFKECPGCSAQNDIAARVCHGCQQDLVDPDDKLKDALKLKDGMVIRCAGMEFGQANGKLVVRYYDEDGMELKEWFDFDSASQKKKFNDCFGRRHKRGAEPVVINKIADAIRYKTDLPHPDFVVARKHKHFWQVKDKIFDYQGKFRKANELC